MKVIFLDIDGVLNDFTNGIYADDTPTDQHLAQLKYIVEATGAELVLSSSWRMKSRDYKLVVKRLADFDMKLFGMTAELRGGRSEEIKDWLNNHREVTSYVILDDIEMPDELKARQVRTTLAYGLLPSHAKKAIDILNR